MRNYHGKYHDLMRYVVFVSVLLVVYVSFVVVRPFLNALLAGALITFIFFPVYRLIRNRLKNDTLSSLIVSAGIIVLVSLPVVLVLDNLAPEARFVYVRAKQRLVTGELIDINCFGKDTALCRASAYLQEVVSDPSVKQPLQDILGKLTSLAIEKTSSVLLSLPGVVLSTIVTFFISFYLFKDGELLVRKLKGLSPLDKRHTEHIFTKFGETVYAVIYGSIIVALVQGVLGGFGFWVFGLSSPVLWGVVMTITAMIPFVGTAIVWLPAALVRIGAGSTLGDEVMVWQGIGLLIYGALIVSTVDNILKPKLIGERAGVHPVLVMIGVLGGLAVFGFMGFILGPLILAGLNCLIDIYEREKKGV